MNLIIDKTTRDEIVKAIANSSLPTNIGLQIINALNSLKELKDDTKQKTS